MDRAEYSDGPSPIPDSDSAPRRSPFSRLSFGHVIMIVAGLLALILNVALLRSSDDTVEVLVAGNAISAGSRLVVADIEFASIAADSPFVDRILSRTTVESLLGQIVTRDIAAGAPLLADDLRPGAAPDAGRAMSIPIAPAQAVAADLRRGDRIDVISVVDGQATFIATSIEVLAVAEAGEGRFANTSDFSVTVAVDDLTALAIAGALDGSEIHVIRSTGAPAPVDGGGGDGE